MWQHLHIQKWVEDLFWKISQNGEPSYTWLHEAAAQEFSEPLCLPPLGHQQGGILTDILNHWDTKQHILQQSQKLYDSQPYLSSGWWPLERYATQEMISVNTTTLMCYVCFQFFKDKESKTKHWREIHLLNFEQTEAHQGSLKWIIYLCRYSFVMSMPTLLFCYDLNSDRPARPRLSALYIVTELSLLMSCTPVTLITTLLTGVEHQVEVGDKYDLKLQIKNRETLHTFIWKSFF